MIETTEDFLRHMKWHEHQAIFVAHDDKAHAHVHVMLNVVHPETGLRLDDNFERRRAQAWALEYEREQGRIYCEQRLKNPEERENSPPRNIWMAFRENQERIRARRKNLRARDEFLAEQQKNQKNAEWKILKEIQQAERTEIFCRGKIGIFGATVLDLSRSARGISRPVGGFLCGAKRWRRSGHSWRP